MNTIIITNETERSLASRACSWKMANVFTMKDTLSLIIERIDNVEDLVSLGGTSKAVHNLLREMIQKNETTKKYTVRYPREEHFRNENNKKMRKHDVEKSYNYQKYSYTLARFFKVPCANTKQLFDLNAVPRCEFDGYDYKTRKTSLEGIVWKNGCFKNNVFDSITIDKRCNTLDCVTFENLKTNIVSNMPVKNCTFRDFSIGGQMKNVCNTRFLGDEILQSEFVRMSFGGPAYYKNCTFKRVYFFHCNFMDSIFEDCVFEDCHFLGCNIDACIFMSKLTKVLFEDSDLKNTWFLPYLKNEDEYGLIVKSLSFIGCKISRVCLNCFHEKDAYHNGMVHYRHLFAFIETNLEYVSNCTNVMYDRLVIKKNSTHNQDPTAGFLIHYSSRCKNRSVVQNNIHRF